MFSRGNSKRLSNNGKRNSMDMRSKVPPLEELRNCISQLEGLVEIARQRLINDTKRMQSLGQSKSRAQPQQQVPLQSQKRNKLRRDKRSRKSDQDADNTKTNLPSSHSSSSTSRQEQQQQQQQQQPKVPRAQFISLETDQEKEMVEVIRRLAEIVVLGELSGDETQNNNSSVSVFEHFCERNALGLIVSIVQGSCFQINHEETGQQQQQQNQSLSPQSDGSTNKFTSNQCDKMIEEYCAGRNNNNLVYLPPLSVATQAIQSVSILIQNVVRVTSLYFLLSNNRVNDLIHLPLELYTLAEERERGIDKNNHGKNEPSIRPKSEMSAEMSELATHFISFLKSLALRMNVETLQFFLKYPSVVVEQPSSNVGQDIFNLKDVEFPLYARALEFCSPNHDNFVRVTAMNICLNTLRLGAVNETDNADDSSHELDSCSASTGRTSRTGSVHTSTIGNGSVDFEGNVSFNDNASTSNTEDLVSPDGSLHNAELLPLRERLAIVQHICDPSRVESLMSPIFFKLAQLCGFIEESLRSLQKIDQSINNSVASLTAIMKRANYRKTESELINLKNNKEKHSSPNRKRTPTNKSNTAPINHLDQALLLEERKNRQAYFDERKKAVQSIKNYIADLQDELLLLEDVLQVGLVTLNEQIIEMMFATFIYPLLLQPLSLYMQRHRPISMTGNADDHEGNSSFSSVATEESKPTHPFASITPSISLNRWGLLSKEDKNGSGIDKILPKSSKGTSHVFNNISISSSNPDSSPARMALFGMASIFHVISNKPLLHLLLTALLHPLAPDPSVGFMVSRNQQILTVNKKGKFQIHVESIMSAFRKSSSIPESYKFGTEDIVRNMENMKIEKNMNCITSGKKCTFVLSPALADVFEGAICGKIPSMVKTRTNPYRRVFLACLAGTAGMTTLQPLAVLVLDAVLSSLSKRVLNEILFGAKIVTNVENNFMKAPKNPKSKNTNSAQSTSPNYMVEVIASMCVSVMTAKTSVNGKYLRARFLASHFS